jgi:hypothetical protein
VRWPATEAAGALAVGAWEPAGLSVPPTPATTDREALRLGTWRPLWAAEEVDLSPVLRFMRPRQMVELSPVDADRLGVMDGDQVEVGSNGTRVRGTAHLRASVPGGSVFLVAGTHEEPANLLTEAVVAVQKVGGLATTAPDAAAAILTPAGEGQAEAPPSAPLDLPGSDPAPGSAA